MKHRMWVSAVCALTVLSYCGNATADYVLTPRSGGSGSAIVGRGRTLNLNLGLTSDSSDTHTSAIFRVVFSSPGLTYQSYLWQAPYSNTSGDDDSTPRAEQLPVTLTADTLSGPSFPPGVVDVELSNVVESGTFGQGSLVTLTLGVPAGYTGPDSITISAAPDTFANGFDEIVTTAGPPFTLTIVPEPSAAVLGCAALLALSGRSLHRRQRGT